MFYQKKCPYCSKSFDTDNSRKIYCSPSCRDKDRYLRLVKATKQHLPIKCAECDKLFIPFRQGQIFCSYSCKDKNYRRLNAEKIAQQQKAAKQARLEKKVAQAECKPVKTLNEWAREAMECNLDYGTYQAKIQAGYTFEQLKELYADHVTPAHAHCSSARRHSTDSDYGVKLAWNYLS